MAVPGTREGKEWNMKCGNVIEEEALGSHPTAKGRAAASRRAEEGKEEQSEADRENLAKIRNNVQRKNVLVAAIETGHLLGEETNLALSNSRVVEGEIVVPTEEGADLAGIKKIILAQLTIDSTNANNDWKDVSKNHLYYLCLFD